MWHWGKYSRPHVCIEKAVEADSAGEIPFAMPFLQCHHHVVNNLQSSLSVTSSFYFLKDTFFLGCPV